MRVLKTIDDLIQSALPFPFALSNGVHGVNIDNESISLGENVVNIYAVKLFSVYTMTLNLYVLSVSEKFTFFFQLFFTI